MTPHTFLLVLKIDDVYYRIEPVIPTDGFTKRAWKLWKKSGKQYTVHLDRHGAHCTCPDWIYRKQNSPEPCKHISSLESLTLLEPLEKADGQAEHAHH